MTERTTIEEKSRSPLPMRPALSLTWSFDPTTGKPVARWTSEHPEMIASFSLRSAA
jgi:hypothetical protein